jgi:hypothetical protein
LNDGEDDVYKLVHYDEILNRTVHAARFGEAINWDRTDQVNSTQMESKPAFYIVPEKSIQHFGGKDARMEWHAGLIQKLKSDLEREKREFDRWARQPGVRIEDARLVRNKLLEKVIMAKMVEVPGGWDEPGAEELKRRVECLQQAILGVMEGRRALEKMSKEKRFREEMEAGVSASLARKVDEFPEEDLMSFEDDTI